MADAFPLLFAAKGNRIHSLAMHCDLDLSSAESAWNLEQKNQSTFNYYFMWELSFKKVFKKVRQLCSKQTLDINTEQQHVQMHATAQQTI